jgi:choline dehydrogenase
MPVGLKNSNNMDSVHSFHYIIIGAGASGCVIANRLSAIHNKRVLLLEAGKVDESTDIKDVGGFVKLWQSEIDWALQTIKQANLLDRSITINQGKVLGGGTSLNAMMYVRGNRRNFDDWKSQGNDGWGYDEVLPYFLRLENFENGKSDFHGVNGELTIRTCPDKIMRSPHFLNAAVELGYNGPSWDYNGAIQENGAGLLQFHINEDGSRCSSSTAFLHPIIERENLRVITGAEVRKLIINDGIATGVEYQLGNEIFYANASQEIILSAGAFGSPKTLLNSGIGPENELKKVGIDVVKDLPGVGKNLQDHLQLPIIYRSKIEMEKTTLLTGNVLFVNLVSESGLVDLQLNFTPSLPAPLAPILPDLGGPICIFLPILVSPKSRGEVRLTSNNPLDPLYINPNYLAEEADLLVLKKGVELVRNLANTSAFEQLNGGELIPGILIEDIEGFIRANCSTLWHPVGTCKMGNDTESVVDSQLRVKGIQKLRIADASIMPSITSGNTVAACFMIGEKASEIILKEK